MNSGGLGQNSNEVKLAIQEFTFQDLTSNSCETIKSSLPLQIVPIFTKFTLSPILYDGALNLGSFFNPSFVL